jgi:DNA-binding CsgD family transcriptional regulator
MMKNVTNPQVRQGLPERWLSKDDVRLYRLAVAHPGWNRVEAARLLEVSSAQLDERIESLVQLNLLRRSIDPDREFDAVSPELAIAGLLVEDENEIRLRQAQLARVRQEVQALLPTYFEARQERRAAEAIDVLDDVEMVRQMLADHSRRARHSIHIAHPGGGMSDEGLARSLALDLLMLDRGVIMRSVLQHSTRDHAPTQRYATVVMSRGAEIRTVPVVPRRIIVFDREVAFLPRLRDEDRHGAVVVREPDIVEHLLASFANMFAIGRAFPVGLGEDTDEEVLTETHRAILRQMAAGEKDEGIARRLGMSVRTCRRHIATILENLGAQSRFQAGVRAEQRGLLG